jgi:nicotinate-nucleotide adenylyltransferase
MTRTGLLGGSFDPIHLAHVALAHTALQALHLVEVQLIPAAQPWQREPLRATPAQRCAMIELAIAHEPGLTLNGIEVERGGDTYTVDTIRALPQSRSYVWLLGADQLENFCTWRDWQPIARQVDLAVAIRPGSNLCPPAELADFLRNEGRKLEHLPLAPMAISASEIRRRLAQGKPTDGMIAPQVADYIARYRLYR